MMAASAPYRAMIQTFSGMAPCAPPRTFMVSEAMPSIPVLPVDCWCPSAHRDTSAFSIGAPVLRSATYRSARPLLARSTTAMLVTMATVYALYVPSVASIR